MTGKLTGVWEGVKYVFQKKVSFLRSSIIGTGIGIIPVLGGPVAAFFAYTTSMQASKHPETFGKGDPEGVLAPESANNAKDGGALVPTLAFGIPGSPIMAILLAAFMLHGITPGPLMMTQHLDLVWVLIIGLVVANVITSTVGLVIAPYLAKITMVRVNYIAPIVLVLALTGAYTIRQNIWDVLLMLGAGIFAYGMLRAGYPIISLLMGYLLGVIAERAFIQSLQMAWGDYTILFTRPISIALIIVFVIVLLFPVVGWFRARRRGKVNEVLS